MSGNLASQQALLHTAGSLPHVRFPFLLYWPGWTPVFILPRVASETDWIPIIAPPSFKLTGAYRPLTDIFTLLARPPPKPPGTHMSLDVTHFPLPYTTFRRPLDAEMRIIDSQVMIGSSLSPPAVANWLPHIQQTYIRLCSGLVYKPICVLFD